jgi:hypothetical protein
MMEVTANAAAKAAMARAHEERAAAFRAVWSWMRPRRKGRLAGCPA